MRLSHSSTNDGKHPYVKYNFEGTKYCQIAHKKIQAARNKKTLDLMTASEWNKFCKSR